MAGPNFTQRGCKQGHDRVLAIVVTLAVMSGWNQPMSRASEIFARGRCAYPRIRLPLDALDVLVRECESLSRMSAAHAEDLYLAFACAARAEGAVEVFEVQMIPVARRAVARVLPDPRQQDDAVQRVRERLLVGGADGKPKIGSYRGDGPLESWVAVASIRLAVSIGRSLTAERRLRTKALRGFLGTDPELLLMKNELRGELESAVAAGLSELSDRERLLLRLHVVSGMTVTAIGVSLGVSQPTVTRQLARARERVVDKIHQVLAQRFKLHHSDLRSVYGLVASRLQVSLSAVLGTADVGGQRADGAESPPPARTVRVARG